LVDFHFSLFVASLIDLIVYWSISLLGRSCGLLIDFFFFQIESKESDPKGAERTKTWFPLYLAG
jgi:hypothetical protein